MEIGLVDVERLLIGLDRRVVVAELGLFEQSHRVERGQAQRRVVAIFERFAVERDAVLRLLRLAQKSVDRLEHAPAVLVGGERVGAAVELERAVALLLAFVELARATREARRRRLVGRHLVELASRRCPRDAPRRWPRGPSRSSSDHVVLVGDVLGEELRGRLECCVVVLLLLFVQLRETAQELPALVRVLAHREPRVERLHHATPIELREIDPLEHFGGAPRVRRVLHQRLEGRNGRSVVSVELESRLVLPKRALVVALMGARDLAERVMQRGFLLLTRAGSDLALVQRDEIVPPLRRPRRDARAPRWRRARAPGRGRARRSRWLRVRRRLAPTSALACRVGLCAPRRCRPPRRGACTTSSKSAVLPEVS